jgi:hypothetical protein
LFYLQHLQSETIYSFYVVTIILKYQRLVENRLLDT